jgi:hypothetical protein
LSTHVFGGSGPPGVVWAMETKGRLMSANAASERRLMAEFLLEERICFKRVRPPVYREIV